MRSQLKTRQLFCWSMATLMLTSTSTLAAPRVTRSAKSVQAAQSRQVRSIGTISRSSVNRSLAARRTPSQSVRHAVTRRPTAVSPSRSTGHSTRSSRHVPGIAKSHHKPSRGDYRSRSIASRGHGSHHSRHHDHHFGHTSVHIGFGFGSRYVVPPPVTVFEPVYIEPVVVSTPVVMAPPPVAYAPAMQPAVPMSQGVVFEAVVSRDDDIARKEMLTVDGIVLEIEDSDRRPLDVDIDLRVGCREYEFEDLPIGSRVDIHGRSGQLYHVDILDIDDDTETLRFAISR